MTEYSTNVPFFGGLIDISTLSVSLKAAFSVELSCLRTNCSGTTMSSVCTWWLNLLYLTFSSTFRKTVSSEMGPEFVMLVLSPFLNGGFII
jgi:hypothetical protein